MPITILVVDGEPGAVEGREPRAPTAGCRVVCASIGCEAPAEGHAALSGACIAMLAVCLMVLGSANAAGGGTAPGPIVTDRPAFTGSSVVVPLGSLQVENGFAETVSEGNRVFDAPETLLRVGMASKTELRLAAPNYFSEVGRNSGFGDLAIGVKRQLGPASGSFDISMILSLSLPAGAAAVSSHGYDPSVQLPWSRALSASWTAAGMLSFYWPTQEGRRNATGETTFLIDRQLAKAWDAFVEYAGNFPERGGPRHLTHFGTAWRPTPRQQFDMHVGVGLSSAAADRWIGVGYSFRLRAWGR